MVSNSEQLNSEQLYVSVIICNYNYGEFLSQAIESVLGQSYPNFELIVVDDGSTDNSRAVIEAYQDVIIPIFQANGGQGAGFTSGIRAAKGDIICFLDSDDYYREDKLEKVVRGFLHHPEWVQISHGRTAVDRQGRAIGQGFSRHSQGDISNLLLQWGKYAWSVSSGLAYRRSVLEKVLPIPTQRAQAADTYLTAVVPFYGPVGSIEEPLMFYRMHGNNLQAYSDNLSYLISQRELTATYINTAAERVGRSTRFDLQNDVDYRCLKALAAGGVTWTEAIAILWLSLRESWAIGRSSRDLVNRFLRHFSCVFLPPAEGKAVLRQGLRTYLRYKFKKA